MIGSRLVLENIGLELISTRKDLGWTQKQLADKLGVTEQNVQKLEKNKYATARLDTLIKVARALDTTWTDN
ncbi:helix-turn-helix transcriptional regulator [Allocoleopsis sp.]|uniref:helix-turn-helix transcriptional regulator n=1 Tax=Allocoleopsis sp. TaxID=3088169 RepID=UPI002FD3FBBB